MTDPDDPPAPRPTPPPRGGRVILLVLGLVAVLGTALYAAREPARRELARLDFTHRPAAIVPPADPRLEALGAELASLRGRVDALERQASRSPPASRTLPPAPQAQTTSDAPAAALASRVDALAARQDRLDAQLIRQGGQLSTDESRLEAAANQAGAVAALTDRTTRLARLQSAQSALAAGLPLGDLPDAPPALTRYRTDPPPTEAQLRLQFPAIAAAARAAARPDTARLGFWRAMRARAEALVTIRRGDRTILGSPQVGIVDRAQASLDAGDLSGAVQALGQLDGPAAAAAADWRARAQALLEARAALARLASQA